jgi:diguanylate cyclase (GGDEF)-like protein
MSQSDLLPLADRLAVLQGARLIAMATVIAVVGINPAVIHVETATVVVGVAVYAVATTMIELVRRSRRSRSIGIVTTLSLIDAAVLVAIVTVTGGPQSPFIVLCYLQVVAATLVVSYRTGLKAAVLYALALPLAEAFAGSGLLSELRAAPEELSAVSSLTFLVFAIVTAVFSSFNERALRTSRQLSQSLADMAFALERADDVKQVCGIVALNVQHSLDGSRVVFAVDTPDGTTGAIADDRTTRHFETEHLAMDLGRRWSPADPAAKLVYTPAHEDDPFIAELLPDATNVIIVPVVADQRQLGVIIADYGGKRQARVPVATIETLGRIANHAALVLLNMDLLKTVATLAARDPLTDLPNRRTFNTALDREIARAKRTNHELGVVFLDVDHFKAVNDELGHAAGDSLLRELADGLRAHGRGADLVARYGGEEFIILLPDTDRSEAALAAERIRRRLSDSITTTHVTLSAGVAVFPNHGVTGDQLIQSADAAMYEAKRRGRDRTVTVDGGVDLQGAAMPTDAEVRGDDEAGSAGGSSDESAADAEEDAPAEDESALTA